MNNSFRIIFVLCSILFFAVSCKWNDDFRQRQQPQYNDPQPEATFNEDSKYYVGDSVAKDGQESPDSQKVFLPNIDDREPIPEIQDEGLE